MWLMYRYCVSHSAEDVFLHERFTTRTISGVMPLCRAVCRRPLLQYSTARNLSGEMPKAWFVDLGKMISVSFCLTGGHHLVRERDIDEWVALRWIPKSVVVTFDIPMATQRELSRLTPSESTSNSRQRDELKEE